MKRELDDVIVALKVEIEKKHEEFKKTQRHRYGCMEEILGMIQALNFISGKQWSFTEYGLTYKEDK